MKTKNTKLRNKKSYKDYYSKSDGNFMNNQQALYAHRQLDRVAWVREWLYKLCSRDHISIGCKDGYECLTFGSEGINCVGIDPSIDAIDEARLKAFENNIDVTFLVGYGEQLPEGIHTDTLSCLEVLEHVLSPRKLLEKLSKAADYVFISTPDINGKHGLKDSVRNEEHLRLYSKKELEKLLSEFGKIVESVIRDDQICILFKTI